MEIIVERDPICKGESAVQHTAIYDMADDATYTDVFNRIMEDNFIPSVTGSNEVWILNNEERFCLCIYYTKTKKYKESNLYKKLSVICKNTNKLRLAYFESPLAWVDHIVKHFHNDGQVICKDGWADEINYSYSLYNKELLKEVGILKG